MKKCIRLLAIISICVSLIPAFSCGGGEDAISGLFSGSNPGQTWRTQHSSLQRESSGTLKATFWKGYEDTGFDTNKLPATDWSRWKSLQFEMQNPYQQPFSVYVRISDHANQPPDHTYTGGTFDGYVIGPGKNTVQISLENMRSPEDQPINAKHIAYFGVYVSPLFLRDGMELKFSKDKTFQLSNLRLSSDPAKTQKQPYGDLLFKTTAPELVAKRKQVEEEIANLNDLIKQAKDNKIDTAYQEIYPFLANVAFKTRLVAFWQSRTDEQRKALDFLDSGAQTAIANLKAEIAGKKQPLSVPPVPPYSEMRISHGYFTAGSKSMLLLGMLYNSHGPLLRWFANASTAYGTELVAGATRQNVEHQPIWKAYHKYPDTHRVGWNNADHIVRDSGSWEVVGPAVNVCLESPHSRDAVAEMINKYEHNHPGMGNHLVQNMGFEYSYVCYCHYTESMWADWLQKKYHSIADADKIWKTGYKSFSVVPMPHPQDAHSNRALWFDWCSFNLDRFLKQIAWTRDQVRKVQPHVPLTVGSPEIEFSPRAWTGVDEEALADSGITAVELEENYRLDSLMPEYLHAVAGSQPVADFEYHGIVDQLMPSFLHGDAAISMWWWNDQMHWTPNEPINEWASSFPQSYTIPSSDIAEAMRDALDVRRLSPEIIALATAHRPAEILYSKTSMLQHLPEESKGTDTFPYLFSLGELYDASQSAGAYLGVTTEKKILAGDLRSRKLLILPAAQFLPTDVVQKTLAWVRQGGTLAVWPDSMLADQYARPTDTLKLLGLTLVRREQPKFPRGETQVTKYNLADLPHETLQLVSTDIFAKAKPQLEVAGEKQIIKCNPHWVLAKFPDGSPAIIRIPLGRGGIYWFAAPLTPLSWSRLLPILNAHAGINPPLRVSSSNPDQLASLEFRATAYRGEHLAYFFNDSSDALDFKIEPQFHFSKIINLRTEEPLPGPEMKLAPHATAIVEFK